MPFVPRVALRKAIFGAAACVWLGVACSGQGIVDVRHQPSGTTWITLGDELRVTLGNVGPAEYASPPTLSSNVLSFLDVSVIPPFNPGGPTQQFRFRAASRGQAIITFRRMLDTSIVSKVVDTVNVR